MDYNHQSTATATVIDDRTPPSGASDSDPIEAVPRNPFASPYGSMPASTMGSSTGVQSVQPQRYFHSRRIVKGTAERPWLEKKDPKQKWVTIIPLIGIFIGIALTGFLVYDGLQTVSNHVYCPVMIEDFSSGLDTTKWTKEAEVGGFGNGQFDQTTTDDENVFIQDGMLVIKPTLQDANLMTTDNTINLLADGSCASAVWSDCVVSTNTTNGTVVNPAKSARLTTRGKASIKYGRIEVVAKMPAGDWLWPAIWLLPVNNTYGPWPASGEIDIVESRGNNYTYAQGGDNIISSTLHWGPDSTDDGFWKTNNKAKALHTTYSTGFHTFGMEWSEKYLFTYVDSRLAQVLYANFDQPFWPKGNFPAANSNGTRLVDPWSQTGRYATPFDEDFYLILNVAVGGTNGWFADGKSGKPWVDASPTARRDFWDARDQWYPTWEKNGQMTVKSVKMYQQQGYNGC